MIDTTSVVLNVNGIGYLLGISSHCYEQLVSKQHEQVNLLCRMLVRQDSISLYGFYNSHERTLFDKLCAVGGVGPKLALSILSAYTPLELCTVAKLSDESSLTTIAGVGRKMASKLMIELRSIIESNPELQNLAGNTVSAEHSDVISDVADGLVGMGFSREEVIRALSDADDKALSTHENALAFALKELGGVYHVGSRS